MVLNAFAIIRKLSFWTINSFSHVSPLNLFIKLCHIVNTYVIARRIIIKHIYHILTKNAFQIETMIFDNIIRCVIIFILMNLIWNFHFYLKFICKSNTQTFILKMMIMSFIITIMLNIFSFAWQINQFVFFNVKTMSCLFFITRKRRAFFSTLRNSFSWIYYTSANWCRWWNIFSWRAHSTCLSILINWRWKRNKKWTTSIIFMIILWKSHVFSWCDSQMTTWCFCDLQKNSFNWWFILKCLFCENSESIICDS